MSVGKATRCQYCKKVYDPTVHKVCPDCEGIPHKTYFLDKGFIQLIRSNKSMGIKGEACREILRNSNLTPHDLTINIRVWSRSYFGDTVWIKTRSSRVKSGKRQINEVDIRRYCNSFFWKESDWLAELDKLFGKNGQKPDKFFRDTLDQLRTIVRTRDRWTLGQLARFLIHMPEGKHTPRGIGYSLKRYLELNDPLFKKKKHLRLGSVIP